MVVITVIGVIVIGFVLFSLGYGLYRMIKER